jgi:hypothetical protein
MAILGVLLGITMCAVAWCIKECIDHRKLIIDLENRVIFDMGERIGALERRKAVIAEAVTAQPKPLGVKLRTWNEDVHMAEAKTR